MKFKNSLIKTLLLFAISICSVQFTMAAATVSSIRIIRADYCGDGQAFTKPYTRIVIIVKNDDNDEVSSIKANLTPIGKSPKPTKADVEVTYSSETSVKGAKRYVNTTLTFSSDVLDAAYTVTTEMLNAKGQTVGKKQTQNVSVDSKGESTCGNGLTVECVIFNVVSARRSLGGTVSQMASSIQYAADRGAKVADTINISNSIAIDAAEGDKASEVWVYYALLNGNGNREYVYNQAKYNSKVEGWEVQHTINANSKDEKTITDALISIKNPCGEIIWHTIKMDRVLGFGQEGVRIRAVRGMSKDMKDELGKKSTTCSSNFSLSEVNILTTNASGIYTLSFDFQFDSSSNTPDSVAMVVQLENCSGTKQNIAITLKYDRKSGTYVGGQALSQSKDCPWVLTKGEIGAYNACGYLTFWTFKYDNTKSNGSGTRNVATANNGKPGLL